MIDKLFNISFKGRHSKMWPFNTEELCMSTEVNFFTDTGEKDTGAHAVLVPIAKEKRKLTGTLKSHKQCFKALKKERDNSNRP